MKFSNKRFYPSSLKRNNLETLKNLKRELKRTVSFLNSTKERLLWHRYYNNVDPKKT